MSIIQRVPWTVQPQIATRLVAGALPAPILAVSGGGNFGITQGLKNTSYTQVGSVLRAVTPNGVSYSFGGTSDYIDLGTKALLSSNTVPFTFTWLEFVGATTSFQGIFTFLPTGAPGRFTVLRSNADAQYGNISFGPPAGAVVKSTTCPALVVGAVNRFVLVARGGVASTTASEYSLYVNRVSYATAAGAPFGAGAANLNYLGWDGADSKWNGKLDDMFLWDSAFNASQVATFFSNPQQVFDPLPPLRWAPAAAAGVTVLEDSLHRPSMMAILAH